MVSMSLDLNVQCYAGYKADERPVRFTFANGRTLVVEQVLDQWYGSDYECFRVRADDGNVYVLRHHLTDPPDGAWTLDSFRRNDAAER
jgi:hypothetical protein